MAVVGLTVALPTARMQPGGVVRRFEALLKGILWFGGLTLLVGLGLGRMRLRDTGVQVRVLVVGALLVICAQAAFVVSNAFDGYDRLLTSNRTSMEVRV